MNLAYISENYDSLKELELCIPINFQRIAPREIQTAESIDPIDIINKSTKGSGNIFLFKIVFDDREFNTLKPISVNTYCDGNLCFAENDNLAVYGNGNSLDDAINDLRKHIVHFYEYYKNMDQDDLFGEALRLKELYSGLFKEESVNR